MRKNLLQPRISIANLPNHNKPLALDDAMIEIVLFQQTGNEGVGNRIMLALLRQRPWQEQVRDVATGQIDRQQGAQVIISDVSARDVEP